MTGSAMYHFYAVQDGSTPSFQDDGETFALSVIDPVAGELVGTARVPGQDPGEMVAHPDGSRLYIPARTAYRDFAIIVVATESMDVTAKIDMPNAAADLAVCADGSRLFAATGGFGGAGTVAEIDTVANKVVRTIDGVTDDLGHLAVSADGLRLYGGLSRDRNLEVRPTLLAEGTVGDAVDFSGQAYGPSGVKLLPSPDGTRLHALHGYTGKLVALDPLTLAVTARYDGGGRPRDIALSTDGQHLYVVCAEGEGRILQPATLKETGRFPANGNTISAVSDGTLCVLEDPMTCVLLRRADPKQRREIRLPEITANVVAAAPTARRPPPPPLAPSYPARFKRGAFHYSYSRGYLMAGSYHQAGEGVPLPAAPEVVKGRYDSAGGSTPWTPCIWPFGSYKHFYKVPDWSDDAYVDEDDIEST
ncbi:hypothetical protein [Kitasatospora paracochleata]|uniref:YncE family protein n=1 Tax=Kitasatospora paracochleata TaxID=58354 RepID=UPI0031E2008C